MEESINGTLHIAIKNYKNSLCYLVAVIQKLHSSPTLNKLSLTIDDNTLTSYQKDLMKLIQIYAKLTKDNVNETYTELNKQLEKFGDLYITNINDGYLTQCVLYYYYLPIFKKIWSENFNTICSELALFFRNTDEMNYKTNDVFTGGLAWFKPKYQNEALNTYLDNKYEIKVAPQPVACAIVHVFPNKDSSNGGHAIVLLKTPKGWFVIDDNNNFESYDDYVKNHKSRIYKIEIQDIDENSAKELSMENRVHRYTKTFGGGDNVFSMTGGTKKRISAGNLYAKCHYIPPWVKIVAFILLIVLVIYLEYLEYKEHKEDDNRSNSASDSNKS